MIMPYASRVLRGLQEGKTPEELHLVPVCAGSGIYSTHSGYHFITEGSPAYLSCPESREMLRKLVSGEATAQQLRLTFVREANGIAYWESLAGTKFMNLSGIWGLQQEVIP